MEWLFAHMDDAGQSWFRFLLHLSSITRSLVLRSV